MYDGEYDEAPVTDEFKREAIALWETSGRMQTEVAPNWGHADDAASLAAQVAGK